MSDELKDIITKLLTKDVEKRLGTQNDADEIVNHPWFADMDWEKLMSKELKSPFEPDLDQIRQKKSDTLVHTDQVAKQLQGKQGDDKAKAEDKIKEQQTEEILISIAQDERNDTIPENQKKLIEKH